MTTLALHLGRGFGGLDTIISNTLRPNIDYGQLGALAADFVRLNTHLDKLLGLEGLLNFYN